MARRWQNSTWDGRNGGSRRESRASGALVTIEPLQSLRGIVHRPHPDDPPPVLDDAVRRTDTLNVVAA